MKVSAVLEREVLLQGVTGSRAHGLATIVSDTDRHGIYALPTQRVLGLSRPEWSQRPDNDTLYWEAGNAIRLALSSNPTVIELLFLPRYELRTWLGEQLLAIRDSLISQEPVRRSYLRNAESQAGRMRNALWSMSKMDWHGDREAEERKIRKRARSVAVTLIQGAQLWTAGRITVTLSAMEVAAVRAAEQDPVHLNGLLDATDHLMEHEPTPLREAPDTEAAEQWLLDVRNAYWERETHYAD